MPTIGSRPSVNVDRRRRVHAKSRKGCGNCKLRRVKCGEERPQCKKCRLYGVDCSYGGADAALRIPAQGSFQIDLAPVNRVEHVIEFGATASQDSTSGEPDQVVSRVNSRNGLPSPPKDEITSSTQRNHHDPARHAHLARNTVAKSTYPSTSNGSPISPVSINSTITAMIDDSIQLSMTPDSIQGPTVPFWHFSSHHLDILARFRDRTALTIGDKKMAPAYRDCICQLAMTHAFLMHMLLSLTLMHDSHLTAHLPSPLTSTRHKHAALTHWTTATKLFTRLLSAPITPRHRDAIWATGVIIGAASFWFVDSATNPWHVWPLKPSEPEDLAWLRLGEGKRMLWRVADPTRRESVFYGLMRDKRSQCAEGPEWLYSSSGAGVRLPARVKEVFELDERSSVRGNPYHLPLVVLSRIRHLHLTHANVISFLYVTAFITPELLALLEKKDVRAVFIIGWWFKMIADGELWWLATRATIEGQAVRIWLELEDREYGLARLLDELRLGDQNEEDAELGLPASMWSHEWENDGGSCAKQMAYWEVEPRNKAVL